MSYVYHHEKPSMIRRVAAVACFVLAFGCFGLALFAGIKSWWIDDPRVMLAGGIFIPIGAIIGALGGKLRNWD